MWFCGHGAAQGQGTHSGSSSCGRKSANAVLFLSAAATCLHTLPGQRKEIGTWGFSAFPDWRTNPWKEMIGILDHDGEKGKFAHTAKQALNGSVAKWNHCVRVLRTENAPEKIKSGLMHFLFCFVLFSWPLILKSCSACSVAAKNWLKRRSNFVNEAKVKWPFLPAGARLFPSPSISAPEESGSQHTGTHLMQTTLLGVLEILVLG